MLEPKSAIPPGWFYMAHLPVVALRLPPANSFKAFGFIIQNADLEIPPLGQALWALIPLK